MKSSFNKAKLQNSDDFKRDTGISLDDFNIVVHEIKKHIEELHKKNPNLTKGIKSSLTIEDKTLLTLYYLRHYTTFKNIGDIFNLSESYSNKIYHYILNIMSKTIHVNNHKQLLDKDFDTILIDVSEQPIERPMKKQKKYYSGKKKAYN